jgi:hypothetical protein
MAQRTQVVLIDDFDGTEITDGDAQSVTLTWSGVDYSIDLSKTNADKFEKGDRAVPGEGAASRWAQEPVVQTVDFCRAGRYQGSRAWAASNGIELSNRGRVPAEVIEKYRAAGN